MVKVKEDMTGWIMAEHGFPNSRLTIIRQAGDYISPKGIHEPKWLCQCSCGSDPFEVLGRTLKVGKCRSCGCLAKEFMSKTFKKYNRYDLSGEYGIGWTTNTNEEFYFDLEDYDLINQHSWRSKKIGKSSMKDLCAIIDGKYTKFHTLLGFKNYDHINRNEFDNRKENFRPATRVQNAQNRSKSERNTSGFIGVRWNKQNKRWHAYVSIDKQKTHLGSFANKEDAIRARLQAEATYYKEFAPQRHLFEEYGITTNNSKAEV